MLHACSSIDTYTCKCAPAMPAIDTAQFLHALRAPVLNHMLAAGEKMLWREVIATLHELCMLHGTSADLHELFMPCTH